MDYQDKLIRGKPIKVGFLEVVPLTLEEIFDYGEEAYHKALSYIFFDVSKLDFGDNEVLKKAKKFLIFVLILKQESKIASEIQKALEIFTGEKLEVINGFFVKEDEVIDEKMWEQLRIAIGLQNKIKYNPEEKEYKPANSKAEEIKRKIKENKERIQKIKSESETTPSLSDLVSALCAKHPSINLFNVWDLTYYQFVNQLERLQMIDDYEVAIQSLLAGADSKKVKVKHWTNKL